MRYRLEYMIENYPPPRPRYSRDIPVRSYPDDHERMTRARQVAEALLAPKPPATEKPSVDRPDRPSRVLETASPPPAPPEAIKEAASPEPPIQATIPSAHFAEIRSWLKYGMTRAQVAEVYRDP